jgi:NAD(P)H-hydrate epimerase
MGLITDGVLADVPRRGAESTKFTSGNVFVIGGSGGLTGAPTMAALAAMRAGAGYVTVGAPRELEAPFSVRLLEAMFVGLPSDDRTLSAEAVEPALKAIRRADAVVLGPGLGRTEGAQAFAREMFERIDVPLVIDADGLNALAGVFPEDLPQRRWPTVLTPHAGELGRLLDVESSEVERARLHHARAAAAASRAIVVLKGDDTLVCSPNGRVAISRGGAPALATAGTGDVLSGVTGALLGKGLPAAHAACAAVFAHVRAGRLAAGPYGPDSVIASDVIQHLPGAFAV